ncbi:LacI family DNA-binding transcriptional regulator [Kribbella monticola]|uniref:LacI family DNA-binding transcriptional regulator n=1 Tax=Kribbella monticola TaxID=2185285 RepID=UPI000DD3AB52|nr:LacI family DNA-binding transcriptional regulator [Kribbella monticola]
MAVTMRDVARHAGVSPKTVSNVLSGYPYIREATRSKVLESVDALGYQLNVLARNLRSGRTGIIGLAVPELSLPYFAELADAVIEAADQRGLTVMIEQTGARRERELTVLSSERGKLVDGLLFSPLALGPEDVDQLRTSTPVVLLGERIFHGPVDHVVIDNVAGTQAAVEHLIASGRRRIAVIGTHPGEAVGTAAIRYGAYLSTLAAAGIRPVKKLAVPAGLWHRSNGAAAMEQLLSTGSKFDAVLCLNDTLALGALRVLTRHGLRVPDDVAVVGFDDIDEAQYSTPTLTSIDPGRTEIAAAAVDLLVARMSGDTSAYREIVAQYALNVRESTAGVRVHIS